MTWHTSSSWVRPDPSGAAPRLRWRCDCYTQHQPPRSLRQPAVMPRDLGYTIGDTGRAGQIGCRAGCRDGGACRDVLRCRGESSRRRCAGRQRLHPSSAGFGQKRRLQRRGRACQGVPREPLLWQADPAGSLRIEPWPGQAQVGHTSGRGPRLATSGQDGVQVMMGEKTGPGWIRDAGKRILGPFVAA